MELDICSILYAQSILPFTETPFVDEVMLLYFLPSEWHTITLFTYWQVRITTYLHDRSHELPRKGQPHTEGTKHDNCE